MAKQPKAPAGGSVIEGAAEEVKTPKKRTNPAQFFQQVIAEGRKVTWTTRNETLVSTIMVLIMVVIMSIFFLIVDSALRFAVSLLLSVNR
jgi:preprotein translocase subunit SecE